MGSSATSTAALALVLMIRAQPRAGGSMLARIRSTATRDIRDALLARRVRLTIMLASALVVAGHAITFMIAARTAGATSPLSEMLPIALLAMMGMVLPSAGGWGPREGVTAWAFAAAGLGAQRGVTTAVVYGVMVFVACLPGAAVLAVTWFRGIRFPEPRRRSLRESAAHA